MNDTNKTIPQHIAIIMDGNGRWASKRLLARVAGHKKGVDVVRKIVKYCDKIGVKTLTLFAFSSENKQRSKQEVSTLLTLFLAVLNKETAKLNKHNIGLKIIGDMSFFSKNIQEKALSAQALLANNTGLKLIIAANYGGRWDILNATQKIIQAGIKNINESVFEDHLSLTGNNVDLLIRTSGELRISNFLLWDIAYSELYFTDTLWPDFNEAELDRAIESFNRRDRRFGGRR